MKFSNKEKDNIFKKIEIPQILFLDYFKNMPAEAFKVYMYIVYISLNSKESTISDMAVECSLDKRTVQSAISYLEEKELLIKRSNSYEIQSLEEKHLNMKYNPKIELSYEESMEKLQKNEKQKVINDINNQFFNGVMSITWYNAISLWFDKYNFDEDTMIGIFSYCFSTGNKPQKYVETVCESFSKEGIVTYKDLAKHFEKEEKSKSIANYIKKKMNFKQNLTEYQMDYVKKWIIEYGYNKEVIDLLLSTSVKKNEVSIAYLDAIITNWHEKGLKTVEEIKKHNEKNKKNTNKVTKRKATTNNTKTENRNADEFENLLM